MTVRELIEYLQTLPEEMLVVKEVVTNYGESLDSFQDATPPKRILKLVKEFDNSFSCYDIDNNRGKEMLVLE